MGELGAGGSRIALVHERLDQMGGSENVLLEMIRTFPSADVWSLWNLGEAARCIPAHVNTTWLARTPLAGRKAASLPLTPLAWRTLPKRDYDVVLTSSHALAHAARFRDSDAVYMHYVYTPARYWWTPGVDTRGSSRLLGAPRAALRSMDRRFARDHKWVAAISLETSRRISKFWGLEPTVIYPPVATDYFTPGPANSPLPAAEYLLGVSRWIPYKRLDLVIKTGDLLGIPVVIAGSGPGAGELAALARSASVPVFFENRPSRERLRDLYRGATALIFPVHEDFGIVPVEAIACGIPVVGLAAGGLLETVEDGVTGRLVDRADARQLAAGVRDLPSIDAASQVRHAGRFSEDRFRGELHQWVSDALASRPRS